MTAREPSLLVFTLGPAGECARRRLLPPRLALLERALHRRNLDAALAAGRSNRCRLEVSSPDAVDIAGDVRLVGQRGRAFGDRFRDAVDSALERSEGPLVVVGSDVPGLGEEHVARALALLGDDRRRVVVGPSPDGGFYLLAAHRRLDAELAAVRWCAPDTLSTLLTALGASGLEVSLLEPLRDLDRTSDLASWLADDTPDAPLWRAYAALVRRLLARDARPPVPSSLGHPATGFDLALAGRAPPR